MRNLIRAEFYKLRISKLFRAFLIWSFFSAIFSVIVIKMMGAYASEAPQEMLDRMLSNGVYNFGVIQVNTLPEMLNMTSFTAIASAFKNYFAIMLSAIFISVYLREEYANGGIRNFIMKGYSRSQVLLSKYLVTVIVLVAFLCSYFFGFVCTSLGVFGGVSFTNIAPIKFLAFFLVQVFLLVSFASICFTTAIFTKSIMVVIANASMVLLGDMAINMISILTRAQLDLSRFWVLSYVMKLTPDSLSYWALVVGFVTALASLIVASIRFQRTEFE